MRSSMRYAEGQVVARNADNGEDLSIGHPVETVGRQAFPRDVD